MGWIGLACVALLSDRQVDLPLSGRRLRPCPAMLLRLLAAAAAALPFFFRGGEGEEGSLDIFPACFCCCVTHTCPVLPCHAPRFTVEGPAMATVQSLG